MSPAPRRRRWLLMLVIATVVLAACRSVGPNEPYPTPPAATSARGSPARATPSGTALLDALRRGGFVIFFRHAATDPAADSDLRNLANCAAQRNLSERGREQARQIGAAFRDLRIPVGTVLSSALCRTRDTAMLAFGGLEESIELTSLPQAGSDDEEERRVAALRRMLGTPPPSGKNTVLVSHLFNIQRAADISLAEGDGLVVQPRDGGFDVLATISPDDWRTLDR